MIGLLQWKELMVQLLDLIGKGSDLMIDVAHVTCHLPRQQRVAQIVIDEKCAFRLLNAT